jgi:hypothetical protein
VQEVAAVAQVTAEDVVGLLVMVLEGVVTEDLVVDGEVTASLCTPPLMKIRLLSSSGVRLTVISPEAMRSTVEHRSSLVHQPTAISNRLNSRPTRRNSSIHSTDMDNTTIIISNSRLTINRTITTAGVVEAAGVVGAAGVVEVIGEADDKFQIANKN